MDSTVRPEWFGPVPDGCDVPHWIPYLSADELGFNTSKLMIDLVTGDVVVSVPTT